MMYIDFSKKKKIHSIDNFTKNNNKSVNITLEDTSTEEIQSLKSNESNKKRNLNNPNISLSKSYCNTEKKTKKNICFFGIDNINNNLKHYKSKILKKTSIKIIPVKNLINNKNLLNKTMYNSDMRNIRKYSHFRKDSHSTHSTAKEYNSRNNEEQKMKEQNKTLAQNKRYKDVNHGIRTINVKISKDYDNKTLKLNGKLIMIKKNLGKYLLNQYKE